LAAPTKFFPLDFNCSSTSKLASSQYHSDTSDFSKHKEATTNKFSRLLFILKHVKTVPNGRFLLLSSACRSKKREENNYEEQKIKKMMFYSEELLGEVWGKK
jgi:hypothetical protein